MKRFYQNVEITTVEGGYGILLDGKPLRTPARAPLILPTRSLAEAVATEWRDQGDAIKPLIMPLTRLATTSIDRVAPSRDGVITEILRYAETDMVCYRADRPASLASRQAALWQPLLDWVALRYDAPLLVTTGVVPQLQPSASLAALRAAVTELDDMSLAALHAATVSCGSVVIGLALLDGHLDAAGAWAASQLDETYQIETWGEDSEAAMRRNALHADIAATARFMELLRG